MTTLTPAPIAGDSVVHAVAVAPAGEPLGKVAHDPVDAEPGSDQGGDGAEPAHAVLLGHQGPWTSTKEAITPCSWQEPSSASGWTEHLTRG